MSPHQSRTPGEQVPLSPTSANLIDALKESSTTGFQAAASLLDQGADINGRRWFCPRYRISGPVIPHDSVTPLFDAAQRGDFEAVKFLIDQGADVRIKNHTFTAVGQVALPPKNPVETLCGLDAMRTSKEGKIVKLAEEMFGPETPEDHARRRDAFDALPGYYPRKKGQPMKPSRIRSRVKNVLKTTTTKPVGQHRYNLRSRSSASGT